MSPDIQEIVEQLRQHPRLIIADDFEISVQRQLAASTKYHNGEASLRSEHAGYWISLRLLHRRQPGRAVTHARTKQALSSLVDEAFDSASRSSVDLWFRFPLWKTPRATGSMSASDSDFATENPPLYPKLTIFPDVLDETYETREIETRLCRKSERISLHHLRRVYSLQYSLLNHSGDKFYWLREERAHSRPLREREDWLEELMRRSHSLRQGRLFEGMTGSAPVVCSPPAAAAILRQMTPWFFADGTQNGRSPLAARARPSPLFSRAVTIVDSGNLPEAVSSAPFDMEGSLTQQTVLVQKGELKEFLYDTYCATRENRLSTGNFVREAHTDSPRIGATTIFIEPSSRSPRELIAQVEDGVLLDSVESIEPIPGNQTELVLNGPGWAIRHGQRAEPLWEIGLKIDLFALFGRVVSVGNDLSFFGACGAPSILFENVPLSDLRKR